MVQFLIISWLLVSQISLADTLEKYTGIARKSDGQIAYIEKHEASFNNDGKVLKAQTRYETASGALIALLKTDFSMSLTTPNQTFEDYRDGSRNGLQLENSIFTLFSKLNKTKPEKTMRFSKVDFRDDLLVAGQGLHYYLCSQFRKKIEISNTQIRLIIPNRLDVYKFNLKKIPQKSKTILIELKASSFIIRFFAPTLRMFYNSVTGHLVRYEGISNITDENDKPQMVTITYDHDS